MNAQFLGRLSLVDSLDARTTVALSYRVVNGDGGFALPGQNVAIGLHRHWAAGHDLYVNFGTPAESTTLDRLIVKYVFHVGGEPGT